MTKTFRIALTADFYSHGLPAYPDFDLSVLDECPGIEYAAFDKHTPEITPDQIGGAQGVIVLTPRVTRQSLAHGDDLLAIGRFGVGYDGVDVDACTDADVALCITRGAVNRPVAEATIGWMIALSHHVRMKDRLVREGRWNDRTNYMGSELRDHTLGVIGFGGIARELASLLAGFGMKRTLVFDPFVSESDVHEAGVEMVSLDELLTRSDFVSIHCPLNESTRNLIAQRELARMKPAAYLINTARGGIVDEQALYDVLSNGGVAGAAIDCFAEEPATGSLPFAELDNVLLAPHSIAWTHELFRDIGRAACRSMIDLSQGHRPEGIVNPEVFQRRSFQEKWSRLALSEIVEPHPA